MKTYIAFLRGINVSGHNIIKMECLRSSMDELDFQDVSTYIQSGNVLFRSEDTDVKRLADTIHKHIQKHFGFGVSVLVVTPDDLQRAVADNPFESDHIPEPQPYVAFLSDIPAEENWNTLSAMDFQDDRMRLVGRNLYLHYADGAGNTKLSNAVIERKLKLFATARNWKTIRKLIALTAVAPYS